MLLIAIRTLLLYVVALITIRIMGKSELSKLSPFQLVVIFMIAELAAIPIESPQVSVISGVTAIATLMFIQVLISYLSIKSEHFKDFINGRPSILISDGCINEKELRSLRISLNDLTEQLRLGNSPSISDVDYAVMESNGSLSIIPKSDKRPVTLSDLGITPGKTVMPLVVVSDGYIYEDNLLSMGYDKDSLSSFISSLGIKDLSDVFMAFADERRKLHIYCRNKENMIEEVKR